MVVDSDPPEHAHLGRGHESLSIMPAWILPTAVRTMKALTLWLPWASLVAAGLKTSETRSWPPPRDLIGKRLAIHQGQHRTRLDEVGDDLADLTTEQLGILDGRPSGSPLLDPHSHLPRGVIVATATLVDAFEVIHYTLVDRGGVTEECHSGFRLGSGEYQTVLNDGLGDYTCGRWVWLLDNIKALDEPIPAVGRQRFWDWDAPEGVLL